MMLNDSKWLYSGEYVKVDNACAGYSHDHTLIFLDGVLIPRSWAVVSAEAGDKGEIAFYPLDGNSRLLEPVCQMVACGHVSIREPMQNVTSEPLSDDFCPYDKIVLNAVYGN